MPVSVIIVVIVTQGNGFFNDRKQPGVLYLIRHCVERKILQRLYQKRNLKAKHACEMIAICKHV